MTKQNNENEKARNQLRELKEKYELTWPEMAKVFERSLE
jgi:replication initiation and membrane attachment protein DnaB